MAPGVDPGSIRLSFEGTQRPAIDRNGELVLQSDTGEEELRLRKPVVYQPVKGNRREVNAEYVLLDEHQVGFSVGDYDVRDPLVIDPVLSYSTYVGGDSYDWGYGIDVDGSGNAYVTGYTNSLNFPTG